MDFLKKHYEKVLLGVVLLGLAAGAVFLILLIPTERRELDEKSQVIFRQKVEPLSPLDLSQQASLIGRAAAMSCVDLVTTNKVFNPMQWQKKPEGPLIKLTTGNEVGPQAILVTKITPLYTTITLEAVTPPGDGGVRYDITVEKEAAAKTALRVKKHVFATLNNKTDTFVIREVKGPAENPTGLILELLDTGDKVSLTREKPFKRVDGFLADLKYPPENNRLWNVQRVGAPLRIAAEDYNIVAITRNEVVLSHKLTQKKTSRPYSP